MQTLLLVLGLSCCLGAPHGARRPNVVILYADDLGYGDLGVYGHPSSSTPNLDALAARGARFTQMYSTSPVCSPSRAGLLTGRYMTRSGVYPGVFVPQSTGGLPLNETTLAAGLKTWANYTTGMVGKWHLGVGAQEQFLPVRHGFDSWTGIPYSHDMPDPNDCFFDPSGSPGLACFPGTNPEPMHTSTPTEGYSTTAMREVERERATREAVRGMPRDEYEKNLHLGWEGGDPVLANGEVQIPLYDGTAQGSFGIQSQPANLTDLDTLYTDRATAFIRDKSNGDTPFFLYFAFQHTHHPDYADSMFWNTTDRGMMGDSLASLDWSVGEVLNALKQSGVEDNTLIFFSADNGPSLMRQQRGGNAGLLRCGKGTTYEGGQRVPGIAVWPGVIPAGHVVRDIAAQLDVFPTVLSLLSLPLPTDRHYDGVDMSPALLGKGPSPRESFFYFYKNVAGPDDLFAARWKEWKLHFKTAGSHCPNDYMVPSCRNNAPITTHNPPLLFNLNHDPGEQVPLDATDPMFHWVVEEIQRQVADLKASQGLFGKAQIGPSDPDAQPCVKPSCKTHSKTDLGKCCRTNPY